MDDDDEGGNGRIEMSVDRSGVYPTALGFGSFNQRSFGFDLFGNGHIFAFELHKREHCKGTTSIYIN